MKTIKNMLWVLLAGTALMAGCGKTSYKKTPGGMPYQLFRGKDTQLIRNGNFVKVSLTQKINDSVLFSTQKGFPVYLFVSNTAGRTYDIAELWTTLHVGDSVVTTQMIDTFIKRAPDNIPKEFKKGDRVLTYLKVLDVFENDSLARIDEEKIKKQFQVAEVAEIEKYLADKKITTQRTPSGAFVEVIQAGTGNLAVMGNMVTVNYTGSTWNGEKFDSNTDTTFGHAEPYSFVAGVGQMIRGFDEAVLMMQKGARIKVYVPSMLGYGQNGNPPRIKAFENLVFDLELTDIKDNVPDQRPMPPLK
jgi:FKBP-type peptidyl-prolyl cis-trans isomerase FkpA